MSAALAGRPQQPDVEEAVRAPVATESVAERAAHTTRVTQMDHEPMRHDQALIEVPDVEQLDALELVRTVAAARILMPGSVVRLSAG